MNTVIKLALPIGLALIVGLVWLLNPSINKNSSSTGLSSRSISPWDSLQPEEYRRAAKLIKANHDGNILLTRISLRQPKKMQALTWQEGEEPQRDAEVIFLVDGAPRLAYLDITSHRIVSGTPMRDGMPMLSGTGELEPIVIKLSEHPDVLAAPTARGVAEGAGICLPRTIGRFFSELADPSRERLLRLDCFNSAGDGTFGLLPSTNLYARPIEGLTILYNVTTSKIIETRETQANTPPPHDLPSDAFTGGKRKVKRVARWGV